MNIIRTHKCETCSTHIKVNLYDKKKELYYFFCSTCLKNVNVCSKESCNKLFLLKDELKNAKTIYLFNNNSKFYLYDDIKNIAITKYGSLDNLKKILEEKKISKKSRKEKVQNERINREIELKELFTLNKLEYKNYVILTKSEAFTLEYVAFSCVRGHSLKKNSI